MNEADISQTLGQHLANMTDCPTIVWENKDATPDRPYLVVQMVRVSRKSPGLNGGGEISKGFMQVTIVADVDKWAFPAERLAQDISDRFPKALRLPGPSGGKVTVTESADIKTGFRDGPDWRLPVQINYWASSPDS